MPEHLPHDCHWILIAGAMHGAGEAVQTVDLEGTATSLEVNFL